MFAPSETRESKPILTFLGKPVGNLPVEGAPDHPIHAPGLESTQARGARPAVYAPVSFAARRPYASDEEGWQTVGDRRRKKHGNKRH